MTPEPEAVAAVDRPAAERVAVLPETLPDTASAQTPGVARGRRIAKILALACVVLALAAGVVLRSPLLEARTIHVRGAAHVSRADVLRIAGISRGTNVATFDAGAAERRLEDDPWIAEATIGKHLPSTLVIVVRERQPVAVSEIGGVRRLVASDGTALNLVTAAALLPSIAAADPTSPALTAGEIRDAARAIGAMPLGVRRSVARVAVLADGELRVDLASGAPVLFGPATDLAAKAQALRALLAYAARQGRTIVAADVQVPTAPTARLVAGAPAGP